jgi:hypothetical protein
VLPLWLNHTRHSIHAALIDQACARQSWLTRSVASWTLNHAITSNDQDALAAALDQLLSARPKSSKKWMPSPCQISLILPDSVARYEMLPWTSNLMLEDELRQFAIERFEMINQPVREGWVVQADWKSKDANTLAYALPHALLDALQNVAHQHGLMLDRVMPLSALAHYGRLGLQRHNELRILQCGSSSSALLYLNGKLVSHLMEVVRGTTSDSTRRLISRLQMSELTSEIKLNKLSVFGVVPINLKEIIEGNSPAQIRLLNPLQWREWL